MFPSLSQIWLILKNGFCLFPSLSKSWLFNYGFRFDLCPKVGLFASFLKHLLETILISLHRSTKVYRSNLPHCQGLHSFSLLARTYLIWFTGLYSLLVTEFLACLKFKLNRFFCRRGLIIENLLLLPLSKSWLILKMNLCFHLCPSTRVSISVQKLAYS